jgi:trans-AT polyketide synthase/acyltransferase/oxidoreductase domain-containing protein
MFNITAESLGSKQFKRLYNLKYAYLSGGMYRGIASKEMAAAMGKAGMIGYLGAGGLDLETTKKAILYLQKELQDKPYGVNFLHHYAEPEADEALAVFLLETGVQNIEASAFMRITPGLVRYRLSGLSLGDDGSPIAANRIMAKLSHPKVAEAFLRPAPAKIVKKLLEAGKITSQQAELSSHVPMADAICAEADSGGHTDMAASYTLTPTIAALKDAITREMNYSQPVFLGAAGGIGSPQAVAAAFILGADFVLTGSINQCSVEAGTSDQAKDMLQKINIKDTAYAPSGDMFEIGAKVQVMKQGTLFPVRANKLRDLYERHNSLEEIDSKTRQELEKTYFKKSFEEIYEETKAYFLVRDPKQIDRAEENPRHKMALVFRWYFANSAQAALEGRIEDKMNFQIHTGSSLGAFNQWATGVGLANWRDRRTAEIGKKLMDAAADLLNERFRSLASE